MVFIKTDDNNQITFTHYRPFDEKYGLGKTEEELLQEGFLINEIPTFAEQEGKYQELYYTETDGFWVEYRDIPLTTEEKVAQLEQSNEDLELENASILLTNAQHEQKIVDLENENASILLELAMMKGGN